MTYLEVFEKAKALLETSGWCQGASENAEGQHCATDAICVAAGHREIGDKPRGDDSFCVASMNRFYKHTGLSSIVAWNDNNGRTKDEVLATFDTAIAGEKAHDV